MAKRIENEDQYEKALLWLTEHAKKIENPHPLENKEERKKIIWIYNTTSEACYLYHHEQYEQWRKSNGL